MKKCYFLVLTQQDLLENQVLEEVLRERVNYLVNEKQPTDCWIVMSPVFLENDEIREKIVQTSFYKQNKTYIEFKGDHYFAVLITTSYDYMLWLKLRLGYFEEIGKNILPTTLDFKSDGLFGVFNEKEFENINIFSSKPRNIHPFIIFEKIRNSLNYN